MFSWLKSHENPISCHPRAPGPRVASQRVHRLAKGRKSQRQWPGRRKGCEAPGLKRRWVRPWKPWPIEIDGLPNLIAWWIFPWLTVK